MNQIDIDRYNKGQVNYLFDVDSEYHNYAIWKQEDGKYGSYLQPLSISELLISSEFGWREMFDKDPDYQKEFWEWMEKKDYGRIVRNNVDEKIKQIYYNDDNNELDWTFGITKQMLTGYILEFMQERMK